MKTQRYKKNRRRQNKRASREGQRLVDESRQRSLEENAEGQAARPALSDNQNTQTMTGMNRTVTKGSQGEYYPSRLAE